MICKQNRIIRPELIISNSNRISYLLGDGTYKTVITLTTKKVNGRSIQSALIIDADDAGDGDILVHYDGWGLFLIENENQIFDFQNMKKIFSNNYGGRGFGETYNLNYDGMLNFILYNPYTGVYALLNRGDMTFSATRLSSTSNPYDHTVGDIGDDGNTDLVMGYAILNGSIEVMMYNGSGSYDRVYSTCSLTYPGALSITDLNGDY